MCASLYVCSSIFFQRETNEKNVMFIKRNKGMGQTRLKMPVGRPEKVVKSHKIENKKN